MRSRAGPLGRPMVDPADEVDPRVATLWIGCSMAGASILSILEPSAVAEGEEVPAETGATILSQPRHHLIAAGPFTLRACTTSRGSFQSSRHAAILAATEPMKIYEPAP